MAVAAAWRGSGGSIRGTRSVEGASGFSSAAIPEPAVVISLLRQASAIGEQSRRTPLQEQDDQCQHGELPVHGFEKRLEVLRQEPEAAAGDDRAGQLADTADNHDHETV